MKIEAEIPFLCKAVKDSDVAWEGDQSWKAFLPGDEGSLVDGPIGQSGGTLPNTDINSRYAVDSGNAPQLRNQVFIDITTDWPGGDVAALRAPRHRAMWNSMMDCVNEAVVERALTNHLIHKVAIWLLYWETRITPCAKPSCWLFLKAEGWRSGRAVHTEFMVGGNIEYLLKYRDRSSVGLLISVLLY